MLIALRVGLAKAVQMLTLDRWAVDTGFHAEKANLTQPVRTETPTPANVFPP